MTQNQQTQVRAPWVFGARTNRHRGVEVEAENKLLTVAEAIKQGGLDWLVELRNPISDDDDSIEAPEWRQVVKVEDVLKDGQTVREFRTLGMVKGRYTVLQNRAAFGFFDRATMEGAALIKAVGHLDYGRVVWAIAECPETIELYPGEEIRQNLVLVTAHDGSHAVKVMFNPYRSSTGTMLGVKSARRLRTEVRVRHTASIDERMADVHNVLDAGSGYFDRWRTALVGEDGQGGLKRRIVTQGEVKKVVDALFPAKPKVDEDGNKSMVVSGKAAKARKLLLDRIEDQTKAAQAAYDKSDEDGPNGTTALDLFLGVSEYIDKDKTTKNETNNWVASTFGTGASMRQKAFDLIVGL